MKLTKEQIYRDLHAAYMEARRASALLTEQHPGADAPKLLKTVITDNG